jgi:hypothetical protein
MRRALPLVWCPGTSPSLVYGMRTYRKSVLRGAKVTDTAPSQAALCCVRDPALQTELALDREPATSEKYSEKYSMLEFGTVAFSAGGRANRIQEVNVPPRAAVDPCVRN